MSGTTISSRQASKGALFLIRNVSYRRWLISSTVSTFGDQFYLVALPWLILQGLKSAALLGTVMMAGALPRAVLMLFGGAVTDRVSARRIMLTTAAVRAACVAVIGGLTGMGILSAWQVYVLVIVFGVADAFAIPAQAAYVPTLLAAEQLVAGLSFGQGAEVIASTLGPIPAGLAVAHFGAAPGFIIDAACFVVAIAALSGLPDPPPVPAPASSIGAIRDGIVQVLRDPPLRMLIILVAATNLCDIGAATVGLAFLASVRLGSSTAYGVILAAEAVGALLGSLAGGAWETRRRGLLILVCTALTGAGLVSTPFMPGVWSVAAVQVVIGASAGLSNVHIWAWILQRVDAAFRGRVSSVVMLSSLGIAPLSMALAGFLATWSVTALFVLPGLVMIGVAAAATVLPSLREVK